MCPCSGPLESPCAPGADCRVENCLDGETILVYFGDRYLRRAPEVTWSNQWVCKVPSPLALGEGGNAEEKPPKAKKKKKAPKSGAEKTKDYPGSDQKKILPDADVGSVEENAESTRKEDASADSRCEKGQVEECEVGECSLDDDLQTQQAGGLEHILLGEEQHDLNREVGAGVWTRQSESRRGPGGTRGPTAKAA